jgi:hypothetical protein
MLGTPGTGLLSSGFLQVMDRPFAFSEWSSYYPNEWTIESVTLIAAYGMGLQGWDASYQFTSLADPAMLGRMAGWQKFVVDRVDLMGLYPTFARMIHRDDVKQGPDIGVRRVSLEELSEGGPAFLRKELSRNEGDIKEVATGYSPAAMAVGRVGVEFGAKPAQSTVPDMGKHTKDDAVVSSTGQLAWSADGEKGWVRIDTPGTQAIMGFLPEKGIDLADVSISPSTPFCGVYLTSLDRRKGLGETRTALLTAMARVRDTGMKFNDDMTELLDMGEPPLLLEPVRATVRFGKRSVESVELLDHDGLPTGRTLAVEAGAFQLDGARDKTPYYLIRLR